MKTTTCKEPGCDEPRKTYPSGRSASLCSHHESARVFRYDSREIPDPDNPGQTIKAKALYARKRRRVQA